MKPKSFFEKKIVIAILIAVFILSILGVGWIAIGLLQRGAIATSTFIPSSTSTIITPDPIASIQITPADTPTITPTPSNTDAVTPTSAPVVSLGGFILSMRDGDYYHLYYYNPDSHPFVKLTDGDWDDVSPAVNRDGTKVVYSSNKNGFWDLFLLDLVTRETFQLTVTKDFEGSPAWSPDGLWVVFDKYSNNNSNLYILDMSNFTNPPTQLPHASAEDSQPSWSPRGRQIAFASIQNNENSIWIANLDNISRLFTKVEVSSSVNQMDPAWSPTGQFLSWSGVVDGNRFLFVKDMDNPATPARTIGEGSISTWDQSGQVLYAIVESPNQTDLVGYNVADGTLAMPLVHLPTSVKGISQVVNNGQGWLNSYISSAPASFPRNSFIPSTDPSNSGVQNVVPLDGIRLPPTSPVSSVFLLPSVKGSFLTLKTGTISRIGWDFLNTLDNAFLPLTIPPDPANADAWFYTGRAIAVNSKALSAGWMTIVREDFSGQIYWRVFVRCYNQDGSMGAPLEQLVWDLSSRSSGNRQAYEDGGKYASPPSGYWVDFTDLAQNEGWERMPALTNWRSYYPAIRYNQFAMTGGMDILTSLSQMYPPEALMTYTSVPTSGLILSTPTVHP